jgi:hypothetical protein
MYSVQVLLLLCLQPELPHALATFRFASSVFSPSGSPGTHPVTMLLQRTDLSPSSEKRNAEPTSAQKSTEPLVCIIYFFASQMSRNLQTAPSSSGRKVGQTPETNSVHRLDTLLAKIGMHASFSPLITQFETLPVEIPEVPMQSRWQKRPPKEVHDTLLLVKFRSTRAREEWIQTREWREFMQQTEAEDVFRRIPHVRCARTLKGLRDPMEVLSV